MISTETFRKAMREIAAKKGDFTLFALLLRANAPGTWDLVVSAPWLKGDRLVTTRKFVRLLVQSIGEEPLTQLSQVVVVPGDDPTVQFILANLPLDRDTVRTVRSTDLFGLDIEEAKILRAKKLANDRGSLLNKARDSAGRLAGSRG